MIKIVGLGPGAKEALTLGCLDILKDSSNIFFRTEKHPTVDFIRQLGIKFNTYDYVYDKFTSFDEVYEYIADEIIKEYESYKDIVYAVPGHPFVAEKSVGMLIDRCKQKCVEYKIVPAVSFVDAMIEVLNVDPVEGLKIIDAFDMDNQILDRRIGTIITQVYDKYIASEVKLKLSEYYKDDKEIYFVRAAGVEGLETIRKIPIYEIDRQEDIDYLTSLYIPKQEDNNKDFYDLLKVIETLRSPEGCPWDKEQTHESLKRYLVEEAYEVVDAIEKDDYDGIIEELGDVLLQITLHAQIGKEDGYFDIGDIVTSVCDKMILRHPHVFGNKGIKGSEEVLNNWDEIKRKEKNISTYTEEMNKITKALPALMKAEKIQKKAAKVGFDFDKIEDALQKVFEEFNELKDVYKIQNESRILDEMGDLLFACVNVSRFLGVDSENALNSTIKKFIKRFGFIEEKALENGVKLEEMTLEEMDKSWNLAKQIDKK